MQTSGQVTDVRAYPVDRAEWRAQDAVRARDALTRENKCANSLQLSGHNLKVMIYAPSAVEAVDDDLEALGDADFALVDAFIELVWENEAIRGELALGDFHYLKSPCFDVEGLVEWQRAGYNVYRVKLWADDGSLLGFRLIYAVDHSPSFPRILFLGCMPRNPSENDDYQLDSTFGRRIKDDYENCGVPRIPRRH